VELRLLRYFLAVVETGSVTRAAEDVHVAQPSLSRQLRGLEASLGLTLFDRSGKRMALTTAGHRFLPLARDLVTRADTARAAAGDLASGRATQLTVAAPPTVVTDLIAPFLATQGPKDPLVTVREQNPARAWHALDSGADIVISSAPPRRCFAGRPVARLPLRAYVPAGHPFGTRERVTVAELTREPLILLTPSHGPRLVLDQAALDQNAAYGRVIECETPQVAQAMAASGRGVAVVADQPRYGLHPLLITGRSQEPLRIPLHAAWDAGHHALRGIESFTVGLARFSGERYGPQIVDC